MERFKYLVLAFVLSSIICPIVDGQQPAHRPYTQPDLFNQEAEASDPAGIQKYSEDLIGLIAPRQAGKSHIDKANIDSLSNRLATAEQAARVGKGKLVPEADVARAFNELMKRTCASASYSADETDIHRYRVHAAELSILPSLLTEDRNGANCNPGEAVYLVSLLIAGNGKLALHELDHIVQLRQFMDALSQNRGSAISMFASSPGVEPQGASATILSFSWHHHHHTSKLFNDFAKTLGF